MNKTNCLIFIVKIRSDYVVLEASRSFIESGLVVISVMIGTILMLTHQRYGIDGLG